jgi:hypothetical protein
MAEKRLSSNGPMPLARRFADEARCNIDNSIVNLLQSTHDALLSLRRTRNVLAPVSRLPPELLLQIFLACRDLCADSAPPNKPRVGASADRDAWLALTQVSHQWRQVALKAPMLWNHIDLINAQSSARAEQRAALVPLTLRSDLVSSGSLAAAQAFFAANLGRTRRIDLRLRPRQLEDLVPALSAPAPVLASLNLRVELPMGARTTYELPDALFGAQRAPKLAALSLYGCSFAEGSLHLAGLTSLSLSQRPSSARMSAQGLLDLLARNRGLVSLTLEHVLPAFAAQGVEEVQAEMAVALPALRSLRVEDIVESCTTLLSVLIIPSDAHVTCRTMAGLSALDGLLSAIGAHYTQGNGSRLRAMRLSDAQDASDGSLIIDGWLASSPSALRANPLLTLSLQTDVKLAPLLSLRALGAELDVLVAHRAMDVQDWLLVATQLRALRELRVDDAAARGLIGALELPTSDGIEPLLPGLHCLDLPASLVSGLDIRLKPWVMGRAKADVSLRKLIVRYSEGIGADDQLDDLDLLAECVQRTDIISF